MLDFYKLFIPITLEIWYILDGFNLFSLPDLKFLQELNIGLFSLTSLLFGGIFLCDILSPMLSSLTLDQDLREDLVLGFREG